MRDVVLTAIVLGLLPRCFMQPHIGLMVWCWLAYMNPHKLCWGFARGLPFSQLTALAMLSGLLVSREPKRIPWAAPNVLLLLFTGWMFLTTQFAFNPAAAWVKWSMVWKIQLTTFLIMMVMNTKSRIENIVGVMALSLGLYGAKGGLFTVLTGGSYKVWGPDGTFIGGNNEIGLALIMTVPLLRYIQISATKIWMRRAMIATMVFCLLAIAGTQSRGALLGMVAMLLFLIRNSPHKFTLLIGLVIALPLLFAFMPESWHERMHSIKTYDQDASAMGRINAWHAAVNIARDNLLGGGFKCLVLSSTFQLYAPNPEDLHDAHSIYFEVLAEHGFIGLFLFLAVGLSTWLLSSRVIRNAKRSPGLKWIVDLCSMIQVSLVGYAVSGLFLGLATFDLYYNLIAVVIACYGYIQHYRPEPSSENEPVAESQRAVSFVRPPIRKEAAMAAPETALIDAALAAKTGSQIQTVTECPGKSHATRNHNTDRSRTAGQRRAIGSGSRVIRQDPGNTR